MHIGPGVIKMSSKPLITHLSVWTILAHINVCMHARKNTQLDNNNKIYCSTYVFGIFIPSVFCLENVSISTHLIRFIPVQDLASDSSSIKPRI